MDGLVEGRMVHYVLSEQDKSQLGTSASVVGEHRAAIVVRAWPSHGNTTLANLLVLLDGSNDDTKHHPPMVGVWRPSAHYSEKKEPGTWHWIEKA